MSSTPCPAVELTKALIARPSVTPHDEGCQALLAEHLTPLGFDVESLFFVDTLNMWARRGTKEPVFCFAGHTDVVPSGPPEHWQSPPFEPTEINGKLYGRGAADMKASLAAMIIATEQFVRQHPNHNGSIAFLITSDEEGDFINGTPKVIETLESRNEKITWCLVGEPSSTKTLGDVVKVGRRGSLSGALTVQGKQGHVAYPHLAENPVHQTIAAIDQLIKTQWDQGNEFFPPTSLQISNIHAGTGATNVIPGQLSVEFNFRYSSEVSAQQLVYQVEQIFNQHQLDHQLKWTYNGLPFITTSGRLVDAVSHAIDHVMGYYPQLLTTGGTSDGRFIAPTGAQVVELGPCNATIHQIDECVELKQIGELVQVYQQLLCNLLL